MWEAKLDDMEGAMTSARFQGIQDPAPGIKKNYLKVKINGIDTKKEG